MKDSEKKQMIGELHERYNKQKEGLSRRYKGEEKLLEQQGQKMKEDIHEGLIKKSKSLERDYKQKLARGLSIEEGKLRKQLEKEYKNKLESEMKIKEAQIEKKKQELKRHVVAQARKLLAV